LYISSPPTLDGWSPHESISSVTARCTTRTESSTDASRGTASPSSATAWRTPRRAPSRRAQESAAPWAERFALEVATDERVIEPTNRFEGSRFPSPARLARSPRLWPLVVDPVKPSWGESYRSIAARMAEAVKAAHRSVPDGDVVIVSHQLPIWMVHLSLAGERLFHDPRKRRCALSSITTVERVGDRFVETGYIDAAAGLSDLAVDQGAV
jgi:broad specificity phosphatase PhoE